MSFPARVYRILIASPSDVEEEREIAVRTIQEWNDLNAGERQIVLLPLRCETHSSPEYGRRPQEVINIQVVDYCDLLVGIFWTRIGSPTGMADSGTIEEIERVAKAGKPVMLYFSKAKQDPDKLDLEQVGKLREFKRKTLPGALVEGYSDLVEFRDKLARQLELQLRTTIASESEGMSAITSIPPVTDIVLNFAEVETGVNLGPTITRETTFIDVKNFDEITDYNPPSDKPSPGNLPYFSNIVTPGSLSKYIVTYEGQPNKNYFRQTVTYKILQNYFTPVRFWLANRGGIGARDVYIELDIHSDSATIFALDNKRLPLSPPSREVGVAAVGEYRYAVKPEEVITKSENRLRTQIEVPALQPQREVSPRKHFFIGADQNCEITVSARIFADTLPEPTRRELKLQLKVNRIEVTAAEVMKELLSKEEDQAT